MILDAAPTLHIACLCAAWCRLCDSYALVFESAVDKLRGLHPQLLTHWIDIEHEADLVGDFDVETFPTLVVIDDRQVRFAGPLTPQPATLLRVLRAALAEPAPAPCATPQPPEIEAFATRLRRRRPPAAPGRARAAP